MKIMKCQCKNNDWVVRKINDIKVEIQCNHCGRVKNTASKKAFVAALASGLRA